MRRLGILVLTFGLLVAGVGVAAAQTDPYSGGSFSPPPPEAVTDATTQARVLARGFARADADTAVPAAAPGSRSFARTGFDLLPFLLGALLCILFGRRLVEESKTRQSKMAHRHKPRRV
jgi:hypothetical protein